MSDEVPTLGGVLVLAIAALVALWIAKISGYYTKLSRPTWKDHVPLWSVISAFAIYFTASLLVASIFIPALQKILPNNTSIIALTVWLHFSLSLIILIGLSALTRTLPSPTLLWKDPNATQSCKEDLKYALYSWCIAFPLVGSVGQFFDWLLFTIFQIKELPDQLAVYFVKMSFAHPGFFTLALISISILAPIVEELLFRGFLQSFLRTHLGSAKAILISSVCFALFHFSPEQGLGNIPIIGSLFAFALFLGYLYERQGSLFASIALHSLFNTISILNLYFLGETPRGPIW